MLAAHKGRALLGRHARFPPRMLSTLAGFVEPGESIEEAVAREVKEETSIAVGSRALCRDTALAVPLLAHDRLPRRSAHRHDRVDGAELAEARWVTREELKAALERPDGTETLRVPPSFAIAHQLMRVWVEETQEGRR